MFIIGLFEGINVSYNLMFGNVLILILGLIITLYLQILFDSKRLRNIGLNPYFSLFGSIIKILVFIIIIGQFSSAFLENKDQLDGSPTKFLSNLETLSFLSPISDMIPFMGLLFLGLGYTLVLIFTPHLKGVQTKEQDKNQINTNTTEQFEFKGRT